MIKEQLFSGYRNKRKIKTYTNVNYDYSHYHKNLTEEDTLLHCHKGQHTTRLLAVLCRSAPPRISASTFPETHLFGEILAGNCGLSSRLKLFCIHTCLFFSPLPESPRSKFIWQYQGFLTVEDHST